MSALFGAPPVGLVKGWDDDDPSEPAYPSVGCIDAITRDGGSERNGVETLFGAEDCGGSRMSRSRKRREVDIKARRSLRSKCKINAKSPFFLRQPILFERCPLWSVLHVNSK